LKGKVEKYFKDGIPIIEGKFKLENKNGLKQVSHLKIKVGKDLEEMKISIPNKRISSNKNLSEKMKESHDLINSHNKKEIADDLKGNEKTKQDNLSLKNRLNNTNQ
jgi:hypothetical protein